jgi:hypothetical protein
VDYLIFVIPIKTGETWNSGVLPCIAVFTSAVDDRISAKAIGSVGAAVIALSIVLIILVDISNLVQHLNCKRYKNNEYRVREV